VESVGEGERRRTAAVARSQQNGALELSKFCKLNKVTCSDFVEKQLHDLYSCTVWRVTDKDANDDDNNDARLDRVATECCKLK